MSNFQIDTRYTFLIIFFKNKSDLYTIWFYIIMEEHTKEKIKMQDLGLHTYLTYQPANQPNKRFSREFYRKIDVLKFEKYKTPSHLLAVSTCSKKRDYVKASCLFWAKFQ